MNDDLPRIPIKSDGEGFCHVCGLLLTAGSQTCPECDSPIVNLEELLEAGKQNEPKKPRKWYVNKMLAYYADTMPLFLAQAVLICSLILVFFVLSLLDDSWTENSRIWPWFFVYVIAVIIIYVVICAIKSIHQRRFFNRLKEEARNETTQEEKP